MSLYPEVVIDSTVFTLIGALLTLMLGIIAFFMARTVKTLDELSDRVNTLTNWAHEVAGKLSLQPPARE